MIIAGLGNPGRQYEATRHNVGFMAAEYLSRRLNFSFKESSKFKCVIASGNFENTKLHIIKPQTFMNLSGESLTLVKNYYKENNEDIIVFYDEIDLPLGTIRHKIGGGSAGHNGIKSLDQHIGTGYHKIRIGIGKPIEKIEVANYVLSKFSNEELQIVNSFCEKLHPALSELVSKNFRSII